MKEKEIWCKIKNLTRYEVSSFGKIKSLVYNDPKILKPLITKKGYHRLAIWFDNSISQKRIGIHRLVAIAYIPNPFNLREVNHKDLDKSNNHYKNLEWVDSKGNMQHWADNTDFSKRWVTVYCFNSNKKFIKKYKGIRNICLELNISHQSIQQSLRIGVKAKGYYFSRSRFL